VENWFAFFNHQAWVKLFIMNLGFFKRCKRFRILIKIFSTFHRLMFFLVGPYGQIVLFSSLLGGSKLRSNRLFEPDTFGGHLKTTVQKTFMGVRGLFSPFYKRVSLFGTGYKSYVPKVFKRNAFIFRVGFGGAEIGSSLSKFVKGRARKQRILLTSPFYETLSTDFFSLLRLKHPDPYKAKGVRDPLSVYPLKPGKVRANR
jgi:hypothetical protein